MDSPSLRIFKEARLLFWTWVVVVAAGAAKLITLQAPEYFNRIFDLAGAVGFYRHPIACRSSLRRGISTAHRIFPGQPTH